MRPAVGKASHGSKASRNTAIAIIVSSLLMLAGCGPTDEPVGAEPMQQSNQKASSMAAEDSGLDAENDPMGNEELDQPEEYLFAEAEIVAVDGSGVTGMVHFKQRRADVLEIEGRISGLKPGEHGLHVHEIGNCAGVGALSAGAHFSPDGDPHGSPQSQDADHHAGDLGNIVAGEDGNAEFALIDTDLQLDAASETIVGRAIVVHADADDFVTQPSGNAGKRIGCAVIRPVLRPAYVPD
jgi:Cu-Zn family superoxide dismutase